MATKGYNSYRGRAVGKTIALAAALVVVILAAAGYLIAQNYMVYDDDGSAHIELPIAKKEKEQVTPKEPIEQKEPLPTDEVVIDIREPVVTDLRHTVPILRADELGTAALAQQKPAQILKNCSGDLMIPVKVVNGGITFDIAADIPQEIGREEGKSLQTLQEILSADRYTVAHLCSLCDSYFVRAYPDAAFCLKSGSFWYDEDGWTWLNPTESVVVSYVTTLCKEMAGLGFDEIALDYFSYPTIGKTDRIANMGAEDRVETLREFVKTLREELPEDMNLSVILRSDVSDEFGLSYEMLIESFDRIYVTTGGDESALRQQLPADYDAQERIVTMTGSPKDEGSYVKVFRNTAAAAQETQ